MGQLDGLGRGFLYLLVAVGILIVGKWVLQAFRPA
jgi:hypothetical protein